MVTTFSVLQVAEHIDIKVREAWNNQFWVRGEVSGLKQSARGRVWFDLVETDDTGRVLAQLNVSMAADKMRLVDRRLRSVGQPLANGLQIRIKASIDYWVRTGRLLLALSDIDPSHTAGALAMARGDLLARMNADGSAGRNGRLPTPRLPLRLALITSAGSQAFHDLLDELRASPFPFTVTVADCRVQGSDAVPQLTAALTAFGGRTDIDLVLLTRGGGAEIDLVTFDHADVAAAVADCAIPVWSGIGHHLDSPVAEQVAARGLKTPTALAQAVVTAVQDAAAAVEDRWSAIRTLAIRRLARADHDLALAARRTSAARIALRSAGGRLDVAESRIARSATHVLQSHHAALDGVQDRVRVAVPTGLARRVTQMDRAARLVDLADPQRLIARGWSVTTDGDGTLVTGLRPVGSTLQTLTRGGTIRSKVVEPQ